MASQTQTIKLTTNLEHELFKYYSEEKAKREELQCQVMELKTEMEKLREILKYQTNQEKNKATEKANKESSPKPIEYETDEEELARETEWIRIENRRKKRKLNRTLTPPSQNNANNEKGNINPKKTPKPPPINVQGVQDYQSFYDSIASTQGDTFTIKMMSGDSVKINATNEDAYREITKLLTSNNLLWHTYENKQARPIRVMAKKLHHTYQPERIVEYLKNKGYKIENAVIKLSWRKKEPLNMFMLTFEKDEDINKVYGITNILGCKVEIHPLRASKLVPQCKRCQAYGHTQKYCSKEPRCVKCTGKHLTRDCVKPALDKPKCVHCGEPHPANYRGCIVAKEMQVLKSKYTKKQTASQPKKHTEPSATKEANEKKGMTHQPPKPFSYSQVVKSNMETSSESKLDQILSLMSTFDERLKKLEISAKKAPIHLQK